MLDLERTEGRIAVGAVVFFAAAFAMAVILDLRADTGHLKATREEAGNAIQNGTASCVSGSTISVVAASNDRPQLSVFNNSANTVYTSSNATVAFTVNNGWPILSSSSFNFGSYTGALFCTATGDAELRWMRGITQ